jgi:uncharacterized protein (TIGR00730 family)
VDEHKSQEQHEAERQAALDAILHSPTYRLAESDVEFLRRPELRPVRMQLELLKPEMALAASGVRSTIVLYGSTQIAERTYSEQRVRDTKAVLAADPTNAAKARLAARAERLLAKSHYYDEARRFAQIVSCGCKDATVCDYVITTGGGPGIMEAGNRGAHDVDSKSIGLNITLPHEQAPNPFVTPELCFQFHYFALRKMHFLLRAKALVAFPGGFGTLDELMDALTLRQTHRMQEIPILLYGTEYWKNVINFQYLADEGAIGDRELKLFQYVDDPQQAWDAIRAFHPAT